MSAAQINDGGPAFPVPEHQDNWGATHTTAAGMTLRDYFAAKAMQAGLPICNSDNRAAGASYFEHVATVAYQMADAMLKARSA